MAAQPPQNGDDGSIANLDKGEAAEATPSRRSASRPDEYRRQHLGRESMDRWMLHKTLLDDLLAGEETAASAPAQSSDKAAGGHPGDEPPPE